MNERQHASDCAVHNEPALPRGECDCGVAASEASAPLAAQPKDPAPELRRALRGDEAATAALDRLVDALGEKAGDGTTDFFVEIRQSDLAALLAGVGEARPAEPPRGSAQFNWTREQVGIAIDGVASLVGPENRNGQEANLLHQLQDAYKELRIKEVLAPSADWVGAPAEEQPDARAGS